VPFAHEKQAASPYINRFLQPDTIIPNLAYPQAFNRFGYVLNNPIRFNDPSGHVVCEVGEPCGPGATYVAETSVAQMSVNLKKKIKEKYGIEMSDAGGKAWDPSNMLLAYSSLYNINIALKGNLKSLVQGAIFQLREYVPTNENCPNGGCTYQGWTNGTTITFETMGTAAIRQMNIYHEFGHLLDNSPGMVDVFSTNPNINSSEFVTNDGYLNTNALISGSVSDPTYGTSQAVQHPYSILVDSTVGAQEHWADIFANYVAGNIRVSDLVGPGAAMYNFVTTALTPYIGPP
jgi:hypothetical protein